MKFAFIDAEKAHVPVEVLCAVWGVSRSGYYAHKTRPASMRAKQDTKLAATISAHHRRSRQVYGISRTLRDLKAEGLRTCRKRVERIMRHEGITALRAAELRRAFAGAVLVHLTTHVADQVDRVTEGAASLGDFVS